jgi:tRNA pseudouridine55 synthase
MDGIINLHKPVGITSAKAVYRVRKITRIRKSGHAGTLDPGADGILVVCLGRATKLVEQVMDQPKVYRTSARLDVTSDSLDSDSRLIPVPVAAIPTHDEVASALDRFRGRIQQIPPKISAVKIGGRPAYKRARQGEDVELKPRSVEIYAIRLDAYDWPVIEFELTCGRGTYVRSLVRDLGAVLSTGGCLTALTRTAVGPFCLADAWTFERLEAAADPADALIPIDQVKTLLKTS